VIKFHANLFENFHLCLGVKNQLDVAFDCRHGLFQLFSYWKRRVWQATNSFLKLRQQHTHITRQFNVFVLLLNHHNDHHLTAV